MKGYHVRPPTPPPFPRDESGSESFTVSDLTTHPAPPPIHTCLHGLSQPYDQAIYHTNNHRTTRSAPRSSVSLYIDINLIPPSHPESQPEWTMQVKEGNESQREGESGTTPFLKDHSPLHAHSHSWWSWDRLKGLHVPWWLLFIGLCLISLIGGVIMMKPGMLTPLPTLVTLNTETNAPSTITLVALPNYGPLENSDLIESDLRCTTPTTESCDWRWGRPGTLSDSTEDHSQEDLDSKGNWTQPNSFYTFQAGVFVSRDGPGVIVRIKMRDLCCHSDRPLPVSYFRITVYGAAQAASNPPLSLGPLPTDLARGHQPVLVSEKHVGSQDIQLKDVNEERVLQTFLLLPDPGSYMVQVRLTHFNVSASMISENYQRNSQEWNKRPGMWIQQLLKNSHNELGTKLVIPKTEHHEQTNRPICGLEESKKVYAGISPLTGIRCGLPLAGRWVYNNASTTEDLTTYNPRYLVEHSQWKPYFCQLDHTISVIESLEKVEWLHFTGDSNVRHIFYYVCEVANGTLQTAEITPRSLDPPHMCIGPSSPLNIKDSESGIQVGSAPRWITTYTNWFWGKEQLLNQPDFSFRKQCSDFVDTNQIGVVLKGWPGCHKVPDYFQQMTAPGLTYFGWGSHAPEFGARQGTSEYFHSRQVFNMTYFHYHPAIFPLTTANVPSLIPPKYGSQFKIRNNERVYASNTHLAEAVMDLRSHYATNSPGGFQSNSNIIPIFDLFSPTHAATEVLAYDPVHFEPFFSYEEVKYLMHYIHYATNWNRNNRTTSTESVSDT